MIGASSVPGILGLDKFNPAYAIALRMLEGREQVTSEPMQMGLDSEEWHAGLVKKAGYEVMPAPVAGFVHPELPWLCVHPDGLLGFDDGIGPLELKLRGVAPSEAIRVRDTVQSLVQVHAMGASQGLVSVLHGGFGGVRRDEWAVPADAELFALVADRCEAFLSRLRRGVLPAPDGSDATRDAIRARFARAKPGTAVRATQEVWGWVKRIRELREVEHTAKEQRQAFEHRVQDFMGDATTLISPYDEPAAKWGTRNAVDGDALREQHPDVFAEFAVAKIDATALKKARPDLHAKFSRPTTRRFEANP
jgi:hypothetical protein